MLLQVCQNPTQPGFNHYLFESVAALIKYSAAADVSKVAELEQNLFPAFNIVLQQDVQVGTLDAHVNAHPHRAHIFYRKHPLFLYKVKRVSQCKS